MLKVSPRSRALNQSIGPMISICTVSRAGRILASLAAMRLVVSTTPVAIVSDYVFVTRESPGALTYLKSSRLPCVWAIGESSVERLKKLLGKGGR